MLKTTGRTLLFIFLATLPGTLRAQQLQQRIAAAAETFRSDPQNSHAVTSVTVLDARTGKTLYSLNGQLGLAPASCQKTVTAASALFLLGTDFRFRTVLAVTGAVRDHVLRGDLIIRGGGDPTLGSWRYPSTTADRLTARWVDAVRRAGIRRIEGRVIGDASAFGSQMPPDGWIWQDIGNYYGAGTSALTWHENQYDLHLEPGTRAGDPVRIAEVDTLLSLRFVNELTTGEPGSGDQTYIYAAPYSHLAFLRGTAPQDLRHFTVSGAVTDPALYCARTLDQALTRGGIGISGSASTVRILREKGLQAPVAGTAIDRYASPGLDSVLYWFLKRSINLYGEQLLKVIAMHGSAPPTTDSGGAVEKRFWQTKGIDPESLHIIDGSGLSPGNRITTAAMARILYIASRQPWFSVYHDCLPVIHGIRMKSGHINDVCSYAGYMQAFDGTPLVFSFIVNNYNGSTAGIKQKMFRALDAIGK
jgi:D-alanyl-D-alanine carboxypeptidase/D-alanyl-D-alanine-endopeptidase (penicillin-binding protein 4)